MDETSPNTNYFIFFITLFAYTQYQSSNNPLFIIQPYCSTKMMLRNANVAQSMKVHSYGQNFPFENAPNFQTVQGTRLKQQLQLWSFLFHLGVHSKVLM